MTEHSTFISKQPRGQSTGSKKQMLLYRTRIFKEPEGKMRAKKQHPPHAHIYKPDAEENGAQMDCDIKNVLSG